MKSNEQKEKVCINTPGTRVVKKAGHKKNILDLKEGEKQWAEKRERRPKFSKGIDYTLQSYSHYPMQNHIVGLK